MLEPYFLLELQELFDFFRQQTAAVRSTSILNHGLRSLVSLVVEVVEEVLSLEQPLTMSVGFSKEEQVHLDPQIFQHRQLVVAL